MEEFDLDYLRSLMQDAKEKRETFPFTLPDETYADITYLPSKLRLYWPGQIDSLHFRHEAEKYHAYERSKLRKNTQHYHRIVRKNGILLRIDSYIEGRINAIHLIYYENNKRYSFSYNPTAPKVPGTTDVLTYENGSIAESYTIHHNNQIVYRTYRPNQDGTIQYRRINYVPSGTFPILGKEEGYFTLGEKLSYTHTYDWAWYMGAENVE